MLHDVGRVLPDAQKQARIARVPERPSALPLGNRQDVAFGILEPGRLHPTQLGNSVLISLEIGHNALLEDDALLAQLSHHPLDVLDPESGYRVIGSCAPLSLVKDEHRAAATLG